MKIDIPQKTLAYANNNPGNLRFVGQEGAVSGEKGFAKFSTPEAGYQALKNQLSLYVKRGHTVSSFISKYAPPSENDTNTYIKQATSTLGVSPDTSLSKVNMNQLAKFMAHKESSTTIQEKGFSDIVDELRGKGGSDTKILDYISSKMPNASGKINELRQKATTTGKNDRDIVNFLSQKFDGRLPTKQSNPLEANYQNNYQDPTQKRQEIAQKQGMTYTPGVGVQAPAEKKQGFFGKVGSAVGAVGGFLKDTFVKPAQEYGQKISDIASRSGKAGGLFNLDPFKGQTLPETALQATSAGVSALGTMAVKAVSPILKGAAKVGGGILGTVNPNAKAGLDFLLSKNDPVVNVGLKAISAGADEWKQFEQKNPRAAADIGSVVDIGTLFIGGEQLVKAGEKELTKEAAIQTTKEDVIKRILQTGEKRDIESGVKALTQVNTKGIKSYEDLGGAISKEIERNQVDLTKILETDVKAYKPADLLITEKVGEKEIQTNYVRQAIDDLKSYYKGSKDAVNLEKTVQIQKKMIQGEGLSAKDVNDLAIDYGKKFSRKSFATSGDVKFGVSAEAAENVRSGVKQTVRGLGDKNPALQAIDESTSRLIQTKKLVDKVNKAVLKLEAKIKNENAFMKAGRTVGHIVGKGVDVATGGTLRSFLTSFLPSNIGNKVMNSLDIEASLLKNLKTLEKLNGQKGSSLLNSVNTIINEIKG